MNLARRTWHEAGGVLQAAPAPRFQGAPALEPPEMPCRGAHSDEIRAEVSASGEH
jgi:crotonobetainyl-CoA:carnitine CoA-transferase CaiB-like acyl-CoA transferase